MIRYILLALSALAVIQEARCDDILVLGDSTNLRDTHSIFLKSLQDRGHKLTIKQADDASLALIKYGEFKYQHLIVFAPSVDEFGGSISVKEIINFIDRGGNVLVAASSQVGDAVRELATECGFELDDEDTAVIDHLNFDTVLDDGYHTIVVASAKNMLQAPLILGETKKPVLFKGTGMISDKANPLTLDLLTADSTAYSFNPKIEVKEYPSAIGRSLVLVGGMQARNNARVVFTGSLHLFSDEFFLAKVNKYGGGGAKDQESGNRELADAISRWVFKERGVLRVTSLNHHLKGKKATPAQYTVTQDVEFHIHVEELKDGQWVPYKSDDMQLSFVRIDPFVRQKMKHDNKGNFKLEFKLPDVYGVFKFVVDHNRLGYTHLTSTTQVSVHPLEHTQYERFIRSAFPYYVSAFSMMGGLWLFACVFIHFKEPQRTHAKAE